MRSYNENVRLKYKLLAKIYDLMDPILFNSKKGNPRYALAGMIPDEELEILDVCPGTGCTTVAIASSNKRNRVTGIDLSGDMLRVAERKIRKNGLENVSLFQMDAAKIELEKEFDVVTTSLSLHEMPDGIMDSVISEMSRVLRKEGRMLIIEWDRPKDFLGSMVFTVFPYLFEPGDFKGFLQLDWCEYLKRHGLVLKGIEKFKFTKLIIAVSEK